MKTCCLCNRVANLVHWHYQIMHYSVGNKWSFSTAQFLLAWGSLSPQPFRIICIFLCLYVCYLDIVYLIPFDILGCVLFFYLDSWCLRLLFFSLSLCLLTFGSEKCFFFFYHEQFGKWSFIFLVNLNSKFNQILFFSLCWIRDIEKWGWKNGGEILSSLILFQSMHSLYVVKTVQFSSVSI